MVTFFCDRKTVSMLAAVLLMLISSAGYTAELMMKLNKNQTEMGKFIVATISYHGDKDPGSPNLSEWHEKFYVDLQHSDLSTLPDGQIQAETRVRLYPRVSGQLTLDSLALGGAIAKSHQLNVKPLIRFDIDATPVVLPLQPGYWTDQAIIISVDVALVEKRNNVVVNDFELDGFVVRSLKPQRLQLVTGDVIRLQWMLLTPRHGIYDIELPSIQQRGRSRFRFYLPKIRLNVKPVPAYLPATVPVGNLRIQSELVEEKNEAPLWLLKIENNGRLPGHVEGLQEFLDLKGIVSTDVFIEQLIGEETAMVSRVYEMKIPQWNLFSSNELKLAYFNTITGRLETLQHRFPGHWNIPRYARIISVYIFVLVFFYVANRVDKLAQRVRSWLRFRSTIRQSSTGNQLRKVLLKQSSSKNLTRWSEFFPASLAQQIAQDLNELCFNSESRLEIADVKDHCLVLFSFRQTRVFLKQAVL